MKTHSFPTNSQADTEAMKHAFTPKNHYPNICQQCGGMRITPDHGYDMAAEAARVARHDDPMCAGPWETSTQDENGIDILSSPSGDDPQQYRIAHVVPWPGVEEIANLMAAAPELLKTLEHAHLFFLQSNDMSADRREMLDEMWAAIQLARKGSL